MIQAPILRVPLLTKQAFNMKTPGGINRQYFVYPASDIPSVSARQMADLYNSPIKDDNQVIRVTPEQIRARLNADPNSILLGFLDNDFSNPVAMINVVKSYFDSFEEYPTTHAELTDNDTFSTTVLSGANVWSCPWVVVSENLDEDEKSARVFVDGGIRSLGQAIVRAVGISARENNVPLVVAFTRPYNIKRFIEDNFCPGEEILYKPSLGFCLAEIKNPQTGEELFFDDWGCMVEGRETYIFTWEEYVNMPHPDCPDRYPRVRFDSVLGFHINNGAEYKPRLVRPYAQIDKFSLGMRMGVTYTTILDHPNLLL